MAAQDPQAGSAAPAPGPARSGARDHLAKLLPAQISLPLRAHIGNSREPELSVLKHFVRDGATVVDIGAHKGIYTHWLRRLVGPSGAVLAFEPQPLLHRYLKSGLSTRWYRNVSLSDVALSDQRGVAQLTIPVVSGERQIAWASLEGGEGVEISVRTATLDHEIGHRPISFVKCDVEGHELKVLMGSERVMTEQRPVWLVEIEFRHAGSAVADVLALFSDTGYEPRYLTATGELAEVANDRRTPERLNEVEPSRYVNNFFFVPT